jgi:phosphatidylglycerophosphate synthase
MSENRRELKARKITVFHKLAKILIGWGLTPNSVSVISVFFAALAGLAMAASTFKSGAQFSALMILGVFGVQLRLLCNLVDGLMAVEGGLKTKTGELFNDIPDRISDIFIIMGLAWAASPFSPWALELGWIATLLAVLTAYVRVLMASINGQQDFSGPMAKQHRMFLISLCCLIIAIHPPWAGPLLISTLGIICVGSLLTCLRRLYRFQ